MKFARIALLLVFIVLTLTVMTGCRCKPYKEEWHFFSYKEDVTFINGVTLNMGFSDASHAYPFAGLENQNISISFTEDGKVEFTPKDGKTLYGTYTFKHSGLSYTSFTITLDNGEIIEGSSMRRLRETKLALTYQGTVYNFITQNKRGGITINTILQRVLNDDLDSLNKATVYKNGDEYAVQYSEIMYYPIKSTTAVYALRVYQDGTYEVLDEIYEGEVLSTYNNDADYVVLYYIEE